MNKFLFYTVEISLNGGRKMKVKGKNQQKPMIEDGHNIIQFNHIAWTIVFSYKPSVKPKDYECC